MGTYVTMMVMGTLLAAAGFGLIGELGPFGVLLGAIGAVIAQLGLIAGGVYLGTERLHTALGELDDAISVLDPSTD
jgi:hypothetical protein